MSVEQILDGTKSELSVNDHLTFLHRYNYFEGLVDDARELSIAQVKKDFGKKTPEYKEAVTRFQLFYNLDPTGEVDDLTQRAMLEPRCGCPDILPGTEAAKQDSSWPTDSMEAVTASCNFNQLNLGKAESTRIYKLALKAWNKVCNSKLKYVDNFGTANINAGDGPIDSRWNVLAWSYLPNGNPNDRLEQKYDSYENWFFDFLLAVATHEIGHALGWHHLNNRQSILFPSWQKEIVEPQPVDIKRGVETYGPPISSPGDDDDEPVDRIGRLENRVEDLEMLMKLILKGMK